MFSFCCKCEVVLEYSTNHPQAKQCMRVIYMVWVLLLLHLHVYL